MDDKERKLFDEKMNLEDHSSAGMEDALSFPQDDILDEPDVEPARPPMYEVVMLNDNFTPMDYVVFILKRFFHKTQDEATELTLSVHHNGQGVCGVYTREVAETKVSQVIELSRKNKHPLKCVMRKVYA